MDGSILENRAHTGTEWWKMKTLVMKFGGTSVGSVDAIQRAAEIVMGHWNEWDNLIVVVSAMCGVTDSLIQGAYTAAVGDGETFRGIYDELTDRHRSTIAQLLADRARRDQLLKTVLGLLDSFATFCQSVYILGEASPRAMDTIASLGERMSAQIFASLLVERGVSSVAVEATELIRTDDTFQNAVPLMDVTRAQVAERIKPLFDSGVVPVVTGFIGATKDGVTTTLGRGGSDYTAAILGDCLGANEVWTWTDVDGVMTADPRIAPEAMVIPYLSYGEISELAYFGAKVLHPRTIRPIIERGIPLWVKNTFNPKAEGTCVMQDPHKVDGEVKAVTAIEGLSMLTVEGRGMLGVPGIAARTFTAVASQRASVLMISQASSEQSICFLIPEQATDAVLDSIREEMSIELARRDIDRVWAMKDVVILAVVGAGLRRTPGISAQVFGALGRSQINVIAIAQGSSDCSLSLVVTAEDSDRGVRQIHREVICRGDEKCGARPQA
jgi:aspartokinase/homoserine dehydrogenase 1